MTQEKFFPVGIHLISKVPITIGIIIQGSDLHSI
jgi:hypothetical protein